MMKFSVSSTIPGSDSVAFNADCFVAARMQARQIAEDHGWREYAFECHSDEANAYNRDLRARLSQKTFRIGL
jgi:hypothetical protein